MPSWQGILSFAVMQVRELEAKAEVAQAQRHEEVRELEGKVEQLRAQRDQDIMRLEDEGACPAIVR